MQFLYHLKISQPFDHGMAPVIDNYLPSQLSSSAPRLVTLQKSIDYYQNYSCTEIPRAKLALVISQSFGTYGQYDMVLQHPFYISNIIYHI